MSVLKRFLVIASLCHLRAESYLIRQDSLRSSTISTTPDHLLDGCSFTSQRSEDILQCARACLSNPNCLSFNFQHIGSGVCQLNSNNVQGLEDALVHTQGFTYGEMQNLTEPVFPQGNCVPAIEYVFTALGATGKSGPTNTHGYNGTHMENNVRLHNGMQIWTVPETAMYVIEVSGASGADGACAKGSKCRKGGLGAEITGTFHLTKTTNLTILIGQEGKLETEFKDRAGGGGGGTFVISSEDNSLLIVAGGGGGGGNSLNDSRDGDPGQAQQNGSRCGGFEGQGGRMCDNTGLFVNNVMTATGAGFHGDGERFPVKFVGAKSFSNGGLGGKGTTELCVGGFGGGGFGMGIGGGGGGYSGGGVAGSQNGGTAGGGGSFNRGTSQQNNSGSNKGNGKAKIKIL